jgi:hypothetical protein
MGDLIVYNDEKSGTAPNGLNEYNGNAINTAPNDLNDYNGNVINTAPDDLNDYNGKAFNTASVDVNDFIETMHLDEEIKASIKKSTAERAAMVQEMVNEKEKPPSLIKSIIDRLNGK